MKKEYINEVAWCKMIKFFLANKHVHVGSIRKLKNFVEAIYWLARTGAQWRELPEEYGKWNSIFKRFNSWSNNNVWNGLLEHCIQDPDLEYVKIDATIIRAHACAAGYRKGDQEIEGLGRSKGGFTTKIHAKVDALGNVLKIIITPGNRYE
jgi:transposase